MKTQLAEGQRIQYNFVKPHIALDGQTPAQAAGLGLGGKDKWMKLLENAMAGNNTTLGRNRGNIDSKSRGNFE